MKIKTDELFCSDYRGIFNEIRDKFPNLSESYVAAAAAHIFETDTDWNCDRLFLNQNQVAYDYLVKNSPEVAALTSEEIENQELLFDLVEEDSKTWAVMYQAPAGVQDVGFDLQIEYDPDGEGNQTMTLDEIIEDACSRYSETRSRDEIASMCEGYFDADTVKDLTSEEITKHLTRLFESSEDDYNDLEKWGLESTLEQKLMDAWEKSEYADTNRYPIINSAGVWTGETAGSDDNLSGLFPVRLRGNAIIFVSEDDLQEGADFNGYMG